MNKTLSPPEPLTEHHEIEQFNSGESSLDGWLDAGRGRTRSAAHRAPSLFAEGKRVIGYYALASGAVTVEAATGRFRRNMPDPIPVAVLARLAVDHVWQGKGLGRALFGDAARRVAQAADAIGIRGIVVHAISAEAKKFIRQLGLTQPP